MKAIEHTLFSSPLGLLFGCKARSFVSEKGVTGNPPCLLKLTALVDYYDLGTIGCRPGSLMFLLGNVCWLPALEAGNHGVLTLRKGEIGYQPWTVGNQASCFGHSLAGVDQRNLTDTNVVTKERYAVTNLVTTFRGSAKKTTGIREVDQRRAELLTSVVTTLVNAPKTVLKMDLLGSFGNRGNHCGTNEVTKSNVVVTILVTTAGSGGVIMCEYRPFYSVVANVVTTNHGLVTSPSIKSEKGGIIKLVVTTSKSVVAVW